MTQENKNLLLQDLCARLPYGVKVFYEYVDNLDGKTYGYNLTLNTWCIDEFEANKAVVKPYLRSISSMTEEECEEYQKTCLFSASAFDYNGQKLNFIPTVDSCDWLNANHFDYRNLIVRGLALEAPEGMYNK